MHAYERQYPVYKEQITSRNYTKAGATTYLTIGNAGSTEGHAHYIHGLHDYTAFVDKTHYGLGKIDVLNNTHLRWQSYSGDDGSVLDEMMLVKDNSW